MGLNKQGVDMLIALVTDCSENVSAVIGFKVKCDLNFLFFYKNVCGLTHKKNDLWC